MSAPLARMVARVRWRLFLQTFGRRLVLLASTAFLVLAITLLIVSQGHFRGDPWSFDNPMFLMRLAWLGGAVALAVLVAGLLAWLRRPTPLAAALSLDETFKLQERISTSLAISPEQADTPAGQALAADTLRCLEKLDVAPAYPLKPTHRAAVLPIGFAVCLAAILFCDRTPSQASAEDAPVSPALKAELSEVQKGLKELAKETPPPQKADKLPKGDDFQKFAEELAKLADKDPKTNEEAKDLLKDLTTLEERMRKQEQALADQADALKQQNEEAERLRKKKKKENPPPHEKAMSEGNFQKAADELERLSRELQDDKFTPEEREQLEKDMKDLREQLDRLSDVKKDSAKELKKKKEEKDKQKQNGEKGDGEKGDGEQDLDEMSEEEQKEADDLADAAKDIDEMTIAMKNGDKEKAAQKLEDAAKKLAKCDKCNARSKAGKQLAKLQRLKDQLGRGIGNNQPNPASGKRPDKLQEDIAGTDTKAKGDRSDGGVSGFRFVPGQGLKEPRKAEDVRPLIEGAGREAAEALQRQRIPRADADLTRGYFEKLRNADGKK